MSWGITVLKNCVVCNFAYLIYIHDHLLQIQANFYVRFELNDAKVHLLALLCPHGNPQVTLVTMFSWESPHGESPVTCAGNPPW